jgi:hypothetical protein
MARDLCGAQNLNHATAKHVNTKIGKSVMRCGQHSVRSYQWHCLQLSVLAVILAEDVQEVTFTRS